MIKDDLRKTLSTAYDDVEKKEEERKHNIENKVNSFCGCALANAQFFNFEIIDKLVKEYLSKKEERIREFDWTSTDFYENPHMSWDDRGKGLNDYGITIPYVSSIKNFKDDNEYIMKNVRLVKKYQDTYIGQPFFKDTGYEMVIYADDGEYFPAMLFCNTFKKYGIKFELNDSLYNEIPRKNCLNVKADIIQIEKLIQDILNGDVKDIMIGQEYIDILQDHIKKLQEMYKTIRGFKTLSEKNARIITLDLCKRFVSTYKRLSNDTKPDKELHAKLMCFEYAETVANHVIDIDSLNLENELLIQNFYSYYNGLLPNVLILPHREKGVVKFLPMLVKDFKTTLHELTSDFRFENNYLTVSIDQSDLEALIRQSYKEENAKTRQ